MVEVLPKINLYSPHVSWLSREKQKKISREETII
jgi:hypothetical protein